MTYTLYAPLLTLKRNMFMLDYDRHIYCISCTVEYCYWKMDDYTYSFNIHIEFNSMLE